MHVRGRSENGVLGAFWEMSEHKFFVFFLAIPRSWRGGSPNEKQKSVELLMLAGTEAK